MMMFKTKAKTESEKPENPPMSAREEWADFIKTALIAVLLALLVRSFLYEPFNIPSGSMKPTLEIGDYLFVSKPAYGYSRYSFPFGLVPIYNRLPAGKEPKQGDIVVFKLPTNTGVDFIKRVVGLPGDRVQVVDGRLYLNRILVPREPLGLRRLDDREGSMTVMEYIETLPNGTIHRIYEIDDRQPLDNTEEFTVPDGHYFVMGDNRDNSQDSRVQGLVGFVPYENMVGRASFLFFSTNGSAHLGEVWKWPTAIRYERLFMSLEPLRPENAP
jgi:signal peptidase I